MATLNLGVIDVPYSTPSSYTASKSPKGLLRAAKRGKTSSPAYSGANKTTGDVAEILEAKYHPMEIFFELHREQIVDVLEGSIAGALENVLAGAPTNLSGTAEAENSIETMFKRFLSNKEMDGLGVKGIPTDAAVAGVSHRFAHPYAKRPSRPSLIDTGLYQANAKVWVEN